MALTRRDMLKRCCAGFGSLALTDLLARTALAGGSNPLSPKTPHFPARAKRVIFLFMHGGPSSIDTFDYKPLLQRDDGKPLPFAKPRVVFAQTGNLLKSPWEFKQHGQSGLWVSSLFPNVAQCVDDLAVIRSIHGSNPAHGGACLKMHTGSDTFVRPSMGAWISYGLGTENQDLPSFITLNPTLGHGGVQNFGSAFLPAVHQGTRIGKSDGAVQSTIPNATNKEVTSDEQRTQLDMLRDLNGLQAQRTGADAMLEARIESFELAFRMQQAAPGVMDLSKESEATKKLYGIGEKATDGYGKQCLLARRFAEAGVRFIQCTHGYWDQHNELKSKHQQLSGEVDKPIAGLLQDLKARGMLKDTLVIWGGEFGRTPVSEGGRDGRDHNPHGFTWWMAGGGVKGGITHGATDDYGFYAAENKVHVHDLHATILHLLGLDHTRLTYRHANRDFRLTDVEGHVVKEILA
ncbi:MAG TPA: DUF1501 domain-containing protein [Planctomycetota bacterium]|nr:DUF1501 domain-containing protein [Planctomycetota bacterium]